MTASVNSMSVDIFKLNGKVAWITGGTKGLGFAMANALANAGADIVISSRTVADVERAASEISKAHNCRALGIKAELRSKTVQPSRNAIITVSR